MPRRSIFRTFESIRWVPPLRSVILGLALVVLTSGSAEAQLIGRERDDALKAIPYERLTPAASARIKAIADHPTIYRRLPTQAIDCDPKMFLFLVRHPDVIVGIWEKMDVSQVKTQRIGPYQLVADDNAGTQCTIDLVYGDSKTHVFVARGKYSGPLAPKPITGSGVFILRSDYAKAASGRTTVSGTLDCFIQLDSLGADLLARTLSSLIGKTADHNFVETAKFLSQVSHGAESNPTGMRDLALDLNQLEEQTQTEFIKTIVDVGTRHGALIGSTRAAVPSFIAQQPDEDSSR